LGLDALRAVFPVYVLVLGFAMLAANAAALASDAPGTATVGAAARAAGASGTARVEARSASLLAVGIVQGNLMSIHLSQLQDNAPVRDAILTVWLRGIEHPTVAEADGSYALQTKDLDVPGTASVEFRVAQGQSREVLKGALLIGAGDPKPEEKNSARQLWWWVLNFAVCIGFLMLLSRRRKSTAQD
jgi:hypothetical protein